MGCMNTEVITAIMPDDSPCYGLDKQGTHFDLRPRRMDTVSGTDGSSTVTGCASHPA